MGIDPLFLGRPNLAYLLHCLAFSRPRHIMIQTQNAVKFMSLVLLFLSCDILLIIFVSQIFVLEPASSTLIKSLVTRARSQSQSMSVELLRSNFRSGHISRSFLSLPFFVLLQMDDSVTSRLNSTIDYAVICCTSCRLLLSLSG